jgi:chromosome segregation ATPase
MAFNYRIPAPVPSTDLEVLARLISDPKGAAALFDKYRVAREEYEALRAAIAEEMAVLKKAEAELDAAQKEYKSHYAGYQLSMESFKKHKANWEAEKAAQETALKQKAEELAAKDKNIDAYYDRVTAKEQELAAKIAADEAAKASFSEMLANRQNELDKREAAVAAREEKADKLAALLKGV